MQVSQQLSGPVACSGWIVRKNLLKGKGLMFTIPWLRIQPIMLSGPQAA
jgi:hypothetical protein